MMNKFIELSIKSGDTVEFVYVNIDHILRFYLEDGEIVVLLTNGTNLLVTDISIIQLYNKLNDSN